MTSHVIEIISRSNLQNLIPSGVARITDLKSVSSYTWIDTPTPTIAVPGSPRFWSPPATDVRLPKDAGLYYATENAARLPGSPMAPLFAALFTTNPSFDIRPIDVISDRNFIRRLLWFVNPGSDGDADEPFITKLELVGNTLLFGRHETAVTRHVAQNEYHGHGYEFEKSYTTQQIAGSTSHYSIISYRFCGLNMMIRCQTDAFASSKRGADAAREGFFDPLDSRTLPPRKRTEPTADTSLKKVKVLKKGKTIPLESIVEIMTCAQVRSLEFDDIAPQLWMSQTPKLVRAYHYGGLFSKPGVEYVGFKVQKWERENQHDLETLGALIEKIIAVMKGCGGGCGKLQYDVATASLIIFRNKDETGMLPEDLYPKWNE
ncbi:hypothetical protein E4U17_000712 [Claviceps sp. LM77 group G4]|nr:hypothetical protein E4U17_000712 [Claviceps sp. LM77 group G4]KAG6077519.1 hypothetical protein E4U33_001244 [Claviceps sp. LM78 group G4]KAG6084767.1 hypothetical protein E4U16_001134 [Claviceps sp. LM84 group G4]